MGFMEWMVVVMVSVLSVLVFDIDMSLEDWTAGCKG